MAVTSKGKVFWIVTTCSSERARRFGVTCRKLRFPHAFTGFLLDLSFGPRYVGSMFLTNVSLSPNCPALQPKRPYCSSILVPGSEHG
jgi:hypothetical protein